MDSKQIRRNINYLCERNSDNVVKHMLLAELFLSPFLKKKKKKFHVEVNPPIPQNRTVFRDRVFREEIKSNEVIRLDPNPIGSVNL